MNYLPRVTLLAICLITATLSFGQHHESTPIHKNAMQHLSQLHEADKDVSAQLLFKGSEAKVMSLQLQKNGLLKEHITQVDALLVCVSGKAVYEDEKGVKQTLKKGDFYRIQPMVKHWVKGLADSQLLLIK